jgi:hypothetical protein
MKLSDSGKKDKKIELDHPTRSTLPITIPHKRPNSNFVHQKDPRPPERERKDQDGR